MLPTQNANYTAYADMIQDGILLFTRHIIISIIITSFVIFPSPFKNFTIAFYHTFYTLSILFIDKLKKL